jgi:hypothetical protein
LIEAAEEENIFVDDLEIYFGFKLANIPDNTFRIYPIGSSEYEKSILPIWINKDSDNKYIGFSDGIYSLGDY